MWKNLDRAIEAAKEYRRLVDLGDVARASEVRQSIEDLNVGTYVDGKYTLPSSVRLAMGV